MAYHHILLLFHLLAAAIWVGGHILLLSAYVPAALRENDKHHILNFEKKYEKVGMSALAVLVATGVAMALDFGVMPGQWFKFSAPIERVVSVKLMLLFTTLALAMSAQFNVIPRLRAGGQNLLPLVYHIAFVTGIGVLMLAFGSFIRFGGI